MCFMNCPYEDFTGECANRKMMGTAMAFCCIDDEDLIEDLDEDNESEN